MKKLSKNHPNYHKYERELQKYSARFFQYYLILFDETRIRATIKLLDMILFLFPNWIGINFDHFSNNRIEKYQKPALLNYIPEHILNNVFEFHSFYCRFKEGYLELLGE